MYVFTQPRQSNCSEAKLGGSAVTHGTITPLVPDFSCEGNIPPTLLRRIYPNHMFKASSKQLLRGMTLPRCRDT